jgi:hypothetical protein
LHIEAHGDEENGMTMPLSGEKLPWNIFVTRMREINEISRNNLGVVLACCCGNFALKHIDHRKPSPFYFLIGSDKEVMAGYVDDFMPRFYQSLNKTGSLDVAMAEIRSEFKQFQVEQFFYEAFGMYLAQYTIGSNARQRVERLLTMAVEDGLTPNDTPTKEGEGEDKVRSLAELRKRIKHLNRAAPEKNFEKWSKVFFHGRIPAIDYRTFEQLVRDNR